MNQGKYFFAQGVTFLPARIFDRCVRNHQGDKWVKHFTCWNQLLCMMFGQLSNRDSLRDLLVCINAHQPKHYHLGFGKTISRSNLAEANEKRDYRIFELCDYYGYDKPKITRFVDIDDLIGLHKSWWKLPENQTSQSYDPVFCHFVNDLYK